MNKKLKIKMFLALLFVLILITQDTHAHGFGVFVEKQVGEITVDIGYEPEILTEHFPVRFDFNIVNAETQGNIPFTDIWVRISQGNVVTLATSITHASFGPTGLLYAFPQDGDYELSVRFENEDESIVETVFPFSVVAMEREFQWGKEFVAGILGSALVFLLALLYLIRTIFKK
ncbi:MAG TPA: hypothetical protein VJB70_04415 [Candidatus Paceibacterota bacterium]